MHILDAARQRYATKLYDPARKVPPEVVADLLEVLRLAPSSVNSQPWHFFVAESAEARDRIACSMEPRNPYNADKTRAASHVVVFCARTHLPDAHLDNVLAHEADAGRFASPEARAQRTAVINEYVRLHQETRHDGPEWTARQVYLALGFFLLAAASAGVDATPIEGFNEAALDEDLNLPTETCAAWRSSPWAATPTAISTATAANPACRRMRCSPSCDRVVAVCRLPSAGRQAADAQGVCQRAVTGDPVNGRQPAVEQQNSRCSASARSAGRPDAHSICKTAYRCTPLPGSAPVGAGGNPSSFRFLKNSLRCCSFEGVRTWAGCHGTAGDDCLAGGEGMQVHLRPLSCRTRHRVRPS